MKMHYTVINHDVLGADVIFLHDALGSIRQWKSFPEALCHKLGCKGWVIDRYGHGSSFGSKKAPLSKDFLAKEADDLRQFILDHHIQDPVIVGSSDGGSIGLIYASLYPTKALISIAGHYFNEDATQVGVEAMKSSKDSLTKILEKYHDHRSRSLVEAWQEIWTSERFEDWSIEDKLCNISCPTMIIQGTSDQYATEDHATNLGKLVVDSEVHLLTGYGHFPHLEDSEFVINLIVNFLARNNS